MSNQHTAEGEASVTGASSLGATSLGHWVELQREVCRGGRVLHLAVNRRDGCALELTPAQWQLCHTTIDADPALRDELSANGFLADGVDPPQRPRTQPVRTFLRTLDVRWPGAHRFVRAAYRRGLHLAFRPWALRLQVVLALAGIAALVAAVTSHRQLEVRVAPADVPLLIGLSLFAVAVHELAHALVLVHNNRGLQAAGFRLHLGTPSFYIESVDALLLPRKQRLQQAAAGPWAEWLVTSAVALVLCLVPLGSATSLVHRFVLLNTVTIATNLIPFAGLDGSWLLADLLRVPDLGRRARRTTAELLARDRRPTRADAGLVGYRIGDVVVSAALLAVSLFFWWALFGDAVARMARWGAPGWLALTAIGGLLARPALAGLRGGAPVQAPERTSQLRFRLERRWRVAATRALHAHGLVDGLDAGALGVVAGRLQRHRLCAGQPLHAAVDALVVVRRGGVRHDGEPALRSGAFVLAAGGPPLRPTGRRAVLALLPLSAVGAVSG